MATITLTDGPCAGQTLVVHLRGPVLPVELFVSPVVAAGVAVPAARWRYLRGRGPDGGYVWDQGHSWPVA